MRKLNHTAERVLDFGCGNGRFMKLFSESYYVIGSEITYEMLQGAQKEILGNRNCGYVLTDGVSLPFAANSIDLIWCCAVLRYSLLVSDPVYTKIAQEMFRVLRPGGYVVNCEMYVEVAPETFILGFEAAGFRTTEVHVLHRYNCRMERLLSNVGRGTALTPYAASLNAFIRVLLDNPKRDVAGLRDYLFTWRKPPLELRPQ
jgi:ubiquinone/menaquinone biosynthesis C-methylase UbiE